MDYLYVEKLCEELNQTLRKRRIRGVFSQGSKVSIEIDGLYLNFYSGTPNALFVSEKPIVERDFSPLSFLKGLFIRRFFLPRRDRVLFAELVKILPSGKSNLNYLIFELTGKNANLFVLNEKREILYLLREPKSSVRPLEKGEKYRFPPSEKKPFNDLSFGKVSAEGVEKNLYRFVEGLSPLNSREIGLLFKEYGDLEKAYLEFIEKHRKSRKAYLYFKDKKPKYLTTFPYESLSELNFEVFSGELPFSSAWRKFYEVVVEEREFESEKRKLIERLNQKIESLEEQIEELLRTDRLKEEIDRLKYWGEILKYNLHRVKQGVSEVELPDYSTGRTVKVPLDPSLSPKENLERIFNLYRKKLRRLEFAERELPKLEEEIEKLKLLKQFIESSKSVDEISEFLNEKEEKRRSLPQFKVFTLPSGRKILVGRNRRENEFLSLKASNPWDFWFHVKDTPGSHVILKLQKGEEPTDEDILLSASAAAYFSKGRESGKVLVDYTRVKNLKKPPGTPLGFVTYREERTVSVSSEEFERFLKAPQRGQGLLVSNDNN